MNIKLGDSEMKTAKDHMPNLKIDKTFLTAYEIKNLKKVIDYLKIRQIVIFLKWGHFWVLITKKD